MLKFALQDTTSVADTGAIVVTSASATVFAVKFCLINSHGQWYSQNIATFHTTTFLQLVKN